MIRVSAGLLMYRMRDGKPEVFLVHPGGPFWKNKDDGAWSIPKGERNDGEYELLEVARREFEEETSFKPRGPFIPLGTVERNGSRAKIVHAWAFEGDRDPTQMKSNTIFIDWPPKSGKKMEIPEVDRGDFFDLETAKKKITSYQFGLLEVLEKALAESI